MRFGLIGDNLLERIALAAGLGPRAMLEPYGTAFNRGLMVATKLGIFDALADGPLPASDVAQRCNTHPQATEKLLNLLVSMRYLALANGQYRLTRAARGTLLPDREGSIRDTVLMKFLEWRWLEGMEDFVRDGQPQNIHAAMSDDDWRLYQRGMRAQSGSFANLMVRRIPVPRGAQHMLDVGGSHGYFSVVLCRKYPQLRSTVLDLPEAIVHAAPLLEREGMGDRVELKAGNALTDDLGTDAYDLILVFALVHHFDDATNRELVKRCAGALKSGGLLVIADLVRPRSPSDSGLDTFYDLYFSMISESGLWDPDEMVSWQRDAGLRPRRPTRLLMGQGPIFVVGERVS